ncbi:hypothetical protein Tco_0900112 [Tanacetum coccineum]
MNHIGESSGGSKLIKVRPEDLTDRDSYTNGFRWYRHKESRHGWGKRSSGTSKLKRLLLMTCVVLKNLEEESYDRVTKNSTSAKIHGLDLEVSSKAYEERLNEADAAGSISVALSLRLQIK